MKVNGCDCSIVIKTAHCETDIPYSDETLREAVSLLEEEAAIEGDGVCRAIRKKCGTTGLYYYATDHRHGFAVALSGYGVGWIACICFGKQKPLFMPFEPSAYGRYRAF